MAFRHSIAMFLIVYIVNAARIPKELCTVYNSTGDVYIGGIFSLHGGQDEQECGLRLPVFALQLTEAMAFAVNMVNRDDTMLSNITLGFMIHDDCSRSEYAMWGSLSLVMGANPVLEGTQCVIPGRKLREIHEMAMGVVGTETTSSSEVVISTAGLFKTPHVTYGATGQELYEEHYNPYFFGTISPDVYTAKAIMDLLVHFDWYYVALVYSTEQSVLDLEHEVGIEAAKHNICMIIRAKVSEHPEEAELKNMVSILRLNPSASVVILLTNSAATTIAVMAAAKTAQLTHGLTWVTGDTFSNRDLHDVALEGVLLVEYLKPKLDDFETYIRSLNYSKTNPWYDEFCGGGGSDCHDASEDGFSMYNKMLAPTMDAVFSLARALDRTFDDYCNGSLTDCLYQTSIKDAVLENLGKTSFYGTRGHFKYKDNSVAGQFTIRSVHNTDGMLSVVEVGTWNSSFDEAGRLQVNENLIQWKTGSGGIPKSVCREECQAGYVVEKDPVRQCCWGCRACREGDIVKGTKCIQCEQKEWPNADFTACDKLIAKTVTFNQPLIVAIVSLTAIALLLCGLTTCGMIKHRRHALIKASSRELSAVNIVGVTLSLIAVFPFLSEPSAGICGVAQSLYALSFTLMYAPLLLKVNRIYRIFESSRKTVKRPQFTGSTAQLVIVALFVITQPIVILTTALAVPNTWISTVDLFPKPLTNQPRTLEVFCDVGVGFLTSMCYNFLLLLACCFYAYKARSVPGNFNEARFYVASVYTTLVPIVAALPLYLTADKADVLAFSISLVPVINSYVTLACVYLSKLYAVTVGYQQPATEDQHRTGTFQTRFLKVGSGNTAKVHPSTSGMNEGASSAQMAVVKSD
ncbi:metabotropic glutamate receptor 3-like [Asterias rubens]|uniref:metabotropic glutamate receptor 3-like n=1 Tax=Asterias rubens TaxID=7604 RepID=UPI0014555B78|nr:metabotropic glutamate receptor 3-like [Asterias rubens]